MLDVQTSEMGGTLPLPESDSFLFKRVGSLTGLVDWWRRRWQQDPSDHVAAEVVRVIQDNPDLQRPFLRGEEIRQHQKVLEQIMTPVFPLALSERLVAAVIPFTFDVILATRAFEDLFSEACPDPDFAPEQAKAMGLRNLFAYNEIMRTCYGISVLQGVTELLWSRDEGGLRKYYQLLLDKTFMEIEVEGSLPDVCIKSWECMDEDVRGLDSWLSRIDPGLFTFKGFAILEASDITAQESLARLKRLLAGRSSLISEECFTNIQTELANLLLVPKLHLGMGVISSEEVVMFKPRLPSRVKTGPGQRPDLSAFGDDQCHLQATYRTTTSHHHSRPVGSREPPSRGTGAHSAWISEPCSWFLSSKMAQVVGSRRVFLTDAELSERSLAA